MAIRVMCPNGHALQVKDRYAGQVGLCPHCRARVQVPKLQQVSDEQIAAMLGGPQAIAPRPEPSQEFVHQDPRHDQPGDDNGDSLLGSSVLRRKKVCPQCGNLASFTFTTCARCGTPLSAAAVSPAEEQAKPAKSRHFDLDREGDVLVVRFVEQQTLDESTVNEISHELYAVADRADCRYLLLNFGNLAGLSGLLLEQLPLLKKKIESKGGKLKLCQLGHDLPEDLDDTWVGRIFDIWGTERDALRAFEHRDRKHH